MEKKIEWDYHYTKLGTMPDAELARQLGLTRQRVSDKRKRLGIKKYQKPRIDKKQKPKSINIKIVKNLVETRAIRSLTDKEISDTYGINLYEVGRIRRELGVLYRKRVLSNAPNPV